MPDTVGDIYLLLLTKLEMIASRGSHIITVFSKTEWSDISSLLFTE